MLRILKGVAIGCGALLLLGFVGFVAIGLFLTKTEAGRQMAKESREKANSASVPQPEEVVVVPAARPPQPPAVPDKKAVEEKKEEPPPAPKGPPGTRRLTREEFGENWPLSVEWVDVGCQNGVEAFAIAPDGTKYAVNGLASRSLPNIKPIWEELPDFDFEGKPAGTYRKPISPIVDAATRFCSF